MALEFLLRGMKRFWNEIVVLVAQLCEQAKNNGIVHFERMNLMVFNYISIKKKKKKLTVSVQSVPRLFTI